MILQLEDLNSNFFQWRRRPCHSTWLLVALLPMSTDPTRGYFSLLATGDITPRDSNRPKYEREWQQDRRKNGAKCQPTAAPTTCASKSAQQQQHRRSRPLYLWGHQQQPSQQESATASSEQRGQKRIITIALSRKTQHTPTRDMGYYCSLGYRPRLLLYNTNKWQMALILRELPIQ